MNEVKPTFQHGYGFERGENVFSLPNGIEFDSRQPNAKKGIKGSTKEEWDALHKQFPNLIRKQGEDYTKLKVDALQRLIAKRQVRLKKGESIKELKKDQLVLVLQEWEVFKR